MSSLRLAVANLHSSVFCLHLKQRPCEPGSTDALGRGGGERKTSPLVSLMAERFDLLTSDCNSSAPDTKNISDIIRLPHEARWSSRTNESFTPALVSSFNSKINVRSADPSRYWNLVGNSQATHPSPLLVVQGGEGTAMNFKMIGQEAADKKEAKVRVQVLTLPCRLLSRWSVGSL